MAAMPSSNGNDEFTNISHERKLLFSTNFSHEILVRDILPPKHML